MLKQLSIHNYLFIKEAELHFDEGINVLLGESGVGKSLLINILAIPLGSYPGKDIVGIWGNKTVLSYVFSSKYMDFRQEDFALNPEEPLVLRLEIDDKIEFYLNNKKYPAKKIRSLFTKLIDIHSQNNFELIKHKQLQILEAFMTEEDKTKLSEYRHLYQFYKSTKEEIMKLEKEIIGETELEFLLFQLKEYRNIDPKPGEDEELFSKLKSLKNAKDLAENYENLKKNLENTVEQLARAHSELIHINSISNNTQLFIDRIAVTQAETDDLLWEISKILGKDELYSENMVTDIEDRIGQIESLKRKTKKNIPELIKHYEDIEKRIGMQDSFKLEIRDKGTLLEKQCSDLDKLAKVISKSREKTANKVIHLIAIYLEELKLEKTEITYLLKPTIMSEEGMDSFEFLIKVNAGGAFLPLEKLSGGETSRIMLALKASLQHASEVSTYIFDEIDTGVSGVIAQKMGNVLKAISQQSQLIIISHLPMIVCRGDSFFLVKKENTEDKTLITVAKLVDENQIELTISELLTKTEGNESLSYIKKIRKKI